MLAPEDVSATAAAVSMARPPLAEQYMSRGEAARRLGVPPRTVQEWARHGKLPFIRTLGGHRRFSMSDIEAATDLAANRRVRAPVRRVPT